jgi:probable HAF family extracellular repeat protein
MRIFAPAAIAISLWSALAVQCLAASYSFSALGGEGEGFGINSSGQVVGVANDMGPPVLFAGGTIQQLSDRGGFAYGINDHGQIVGQIGFGQVAGAGYTRQIGDGPFLYSGGTRQILAFPGTTVTSGFASSINTNGDVVGWATGENDSGTFAESGAFLYSGGVMHNLDPNGAAYGINYHGQIVGSFTNGFLFSNGVSQNPGTFPGAQGYVGRAINDNGDIAGVATLANGEQHAFVCSGGVMHDLGVGAAEGINDLGQVVGYLEDGSVGFAFLYSGGTIYYLNDLTKSPFFGGVFRDAPAINDAGQITGTGVFQNSSGGQSQEFLLTPTPEPSSLVLAALGFIGLAWRLRRRQPIRASMIGGS